MFQSRQSRVMVIAALLAALVVSAGGIAVIAMEHKSTAVTVVEGVDQAQYNSALLQTTGRLATSATRVLDASNQRPAQPGATLLLDQQELLPADVIQPVAYEADDEHEEDELAHSKNGYEQHGYADRKEGRHEDGEHEDE